MKKLISPWRLFFLASLMVLLLVLYVSTLYKLQIVEGNANYEASTNSIVSYETVIAARGNILDRYGRLLVSNRNCNNLLLDTDELFEQEDPNAMILALCNTVMEYGDSYSDELPISRTTPFEFTDMSTLQRTLLDAWLEANGLESDATAVEIMAKMRSRYDIDSNYSAEDMRTIAGVRYACNVRYIVPTSDYVFAEDVSIETITALMENDVVGFEVQVSYIREINTPYAAHILGYTGLMTDAEYEKYRELGYAMDATVGKDGAEYAFETYLHGHDGTAAVTRTSEGVVTSTVYTDEPQPGSHVYLSIDIELQGVAETALATTIQALNETREANNALYKAQGKENLVKDMIVGGAVVAIDVKTGEPLCMASYPTYDLSTLMENYSELLADENSPLFNRCLLGTYSPGSTWKPCTALAGLMEGVITLDSDIECTGIYTKYESAGYSPTCSVYPGYHGDLTVEEAITRSCNCFFFEVGDRLGINNLDKYAAMLGLGEYTGIELPETKGVVANPTQKATLNEGTYEADWFAGDTLQASIGQSLTGVTPLQLARYIAAVANNGSVYNCSILKSVSSYDYSESLYEREPEIYYQIETEQVYWDAIHEGMKGVAYSTAGTAYDTFHDFSPTVAAKTGTTQTGNNANDAMFVCYAPYDDPEIAVAVCVEKGGAGAYVAEIARQILEYYFYFEESTQTTEQELTLLR